MNTQELLIHELNSIIDLHEHLRIVLDEERGCIRDDDMEKLPSRIAQSEKLQVEIDSANATLSQLFNEYALVSKHQDKQSSDEIRTLLKKLRKTIYATVGVVGKTVEAVRETKKDIIGQLTGNKIRKHAINAYARTG